MDKHTKNQDRLLGHLGVERYRQLLKYATDTERRRRLQKLLDEALLKQESAGEYRY